MAGPKQDPGSLTFGHLLAQVSRLVGGRMRTKMEGIGLHRAQALILFQLWHDDGMAQNALAHALQITPATATNTLQRMERDGWIERRRDAIDQRIVRVHLTGRARALHDELRTSLKELDDEMTSALSDEERTILRQSLLKVRRNLIAPAGVGPDAGSAEGRGGSRRDGREGPR